MKPELERDPIWRTVPCAKVAIDIVLYCQYYDCYPIWRTVPCAKVPIVLIGIG